jgi:hypothetical protein
MRFEEWWQKLNLYVAWPDPEIKKATFDAWQAAQAEQSAELERLKAENERLKRGDFASEEVHELCHNLPCTVTSEELAAGCAAYQRKLYKCAPDADDASHLAARVDELEALALCERCGDENKDWTLPRYCHTCWNALVDAKLQAERERDQLRQQITAEVENLPG